MVFTKDFTPYDSFGGDVWLTKGRPHTKAAQRAEGGGYRISFRCAGDVWFVDVTGVTALSILLSVVSPSFFLDGTITN